MNELQPTILSLDPPAARAFEALAEYFEYVYSELPLPQQGQLHLNTRMYMMTAASADLAWTLGRMVLARAAGDAPAPDQDALRRATRAMRDEVEREIRTFKAPIPAALNITGKRPRPEKCRESAGALLREIALEERGIEIVLDTAPSDQPVVLAMPIDPAEAAVESYVQAIPNTRRPIQRRGAGPAGARRGGLVVR